MAWILHNDKTAPQDPRVVTRWFAALSQNSSRIKAPTKLHYGPNIEQIAWGYNIPQGDTVNWFKLLLLNDEDLPAHLRHSEHIQKTKGMLDRLQKNVIQVTADYLKQLWLHALRIIEKTHGDSLHNASIHIVFAVPAIFKQYGRERIANAAWLAGMLNSIHMCEDTTLSFVTEPECAVISTLPELGYHGLETGDSITVCDCGGGTVDVISYSVTQETPFSIRECVEGDGRSSIHLFEGVGLCTKF